MLPCQARLHTPCMYSQQRPALPACSSADQCKSSTLEGWCYWIHKCQTWDTWDTYTPSAQHIKVYATVPMAVWAYLRLFALAHSWRKNTDAIKNSCGQPHRNTRSPRAMHSMCACKTSMFTVQPLRRECCSRVAAALTALPGCWRDDVVGEQSNEKFGLMAKDHAMPAVAPWQPWKCWLKWEKSPHRHHRLRIILVGKHL